MPEIRVMRKFHKGGFVSARCRPAASHESPSPARNRQSDEAEVESYCHLGEVEVMLPPNAGW